MKWTLFLLLLFGGCASPASDYELSANSGAIEQTPQQMADSSPSAEASGKQQTFAELLGDAIARDPDDFPFPCSLKYSDGGNDGLSKLRKRWMAQEDDARYRLATLNENCVCPGICVIAVVDVTELGPNNGGLIVYDPSALEKGYGWAGRNLNFSNAELRWSSSTPWIRFGNTGGSESGRTCWIKWDRKTRRFVLDCIPSGA